MLLSDVLTAYGIEADNVYMIQEDLVLERSGEFYLLRKAPESQEMREAQVMAAKGAERAGVLNVAQLQTTIAGADAAWVDGRYSWMFKFPEQSFRNAHVPLSEASDLAKVHENGRLNMSEHLSVGWRQWPVYWLHRLQQLERWYQQIQSQPGSSALDQQFMQTFPYYLGRTETAVQLIDECMKQSPDQAFNLTLTHKSYTIDTWRMVDTIRPPAKLPADFIFDHRTRDIGERLRSCCRTDTVKEGLNFLYSYHKQLPLTSVEGAAVTARLLFPLQFFEVVEDFYENETAEADEFYRQELQALWLDEQSYMRSLSEITKALAPHLRGSWFV
ncbi:spore coat protein YutH [Salsuginibacillus halophilus]|uniref:Spore coat protein YutH n=1 Tax=Salsuginibacillus halophilus TaxID=517424 RepID=A0A2P8HE22_9BACI|nr:hypothetical protein [Salsuginibacillus halophilus]PSL44452.1 spore coat protein YutH [Salsuginibacillus halophilus]